jgi:hypothetical protein
MRCCSCCYLTAGDLLLKWYAAARPDRPSVNVIKLFLPPLTSKLECFPLKSLSARSSKGVSPVGVLCPSLKSHSLSHILN